MTLWTVWVEHNGRVFNHEFCHELKVKFLVMDTAVASARLVKHVKNDSFSAKVILNGFNDTWGARIILCTRKRMKFKWNWEIHGCR